ncbi:ABC transporter permease [Kineosporia sp. NBRC 101731]|uniref:ABC transporter permease n=1 Tax=Kineosporia sp. NBRC 101731 TaxID=3032199 RepID=UPI0024A5714A|nr:ABC transporter permease [Kineosporia sp. NBRC 101731]GLY30199.1 ABC transporter permease [Kineosporia sp. NBRC 101731]
MTATTVEAPPAPPAPARSQRLRDPAFWADWAALVGLIGLTIVFQALNSTFLSYGNVQSILVASAILIILSIGQTFTIATGGIDLSVASVMTFAACAFGWAFTQGWALPLSMVLAVVTGLVFGAVNGALIAKGKIPDFVVTLGSLSAASGLALILADGKPTTVISPFLLTFSTRGIGLFGWTFLLAVVIAVITHVVLFNTRFGTHVLAAGGSPEAATATGISTARIKIAVYTVSGVLAGLAGILLVARIGASSPAADTTMTLNTVAAVVLGGVSLLGGRATIVGPVLGALVLTVLVNGLTLVGVSQFYQPLAVGIVVVLAALLMRFQK